MRIFLRRCWVYIMKIFLWYVLDVIWMWRWCKKKLLLIVVCFWILSFCFSIWFCCVDIFLFYLYIWFGLFWFVGWNVGVRLWRSWDVKRDGWIGGFKECFSVFCGCRVLFMFRCIVVLFLWRMIGGLSGDFVLMIVLNLLWFVLVWIVRI